MQGNSKTPRSKGAAALTPVRGPSQEGRRQWRQHSAAVGAADYSRVDAGVSLVEVMVALSVLGVAITGLLMMIPTATISITLSDEEETARNEVQRRITQIRSSIASGDLMELSSFGGWTFPGDVTDLSSLNGATFEVPRIGATAAGTPAGTVTVADGPDGANDTVKQVTITVSWTSLVRELAMQVTLVTLIDGG